MPSIPKTMEQMAEGVQAEQTEALEDQEMVKMRMKIFTAPQRDTEGETEEDQARAYYVEFSKKEGEQTDFATSYRLIVSEVLSFAIDA